MRWQILSDQKPINGKELLKTLLSNRGLKSKKDAGAFLNPKHPDELTAKDVEIDERQLSKAIEKIKNAIKSKEQIVVYGDYDCDGICATAILWETLRDLGADTMPYIPDRVEDGYGLSVSGLNKLKEQMPQAKLIITVDHGIVAVKQTEYAKKIGLKVIITDHHTIGKKLPDALAIVHTTKLAGAGVSWFLSKRLLMSIDHRPSTIDTLDLAALGTIADMVPLTNANRSIAKYGLEAVNKTKRTGLLALINEAGLSSDKIGTYEIGFIIAPRLNALGRIDNAMDALRLLCTKDRDKAARLAYRLNQVNLERQKMTEETALHAKELIRIKSSNEKIIFISNEAYNQGVIGLVAGRLVEEFYKPAIVISRGDKLSKASARSISGFNIVEAIRSCADILIDVGGHPMAAGFTVETEKLSVLEERLTEFAGINLTDEIMVKSLRIDCELPIESINLKLYEEIQGFKPFGMQNPEPVFFADAEITDIRFVGNGGKHLKLKIRPVTNDCQLTTVDKQLTQDHRPSANDQLDAIAFNRGQLAAGLRVNDKIKIAYTIDLNEWNGEKKIQLKVKDIHLD